MSDREKFLEALNDEDIKGKRSKILLNAGADKHRLEVERFVDVLEEESLDIDEIENDKGIYEALMNLTGLQRKDVLRNCFKKIGLQVDNGELNKLDKVSSAKLFFSVFDVYPKYSGTEDNGSTGGSSVDNGKGKDEEDSADDSAITKIIQKVFTNYNGKKYTIPEPKLKAMLNVERIDSVETVKSALKAMKGQNVKDLISEGCELHGIEIDKGEFGKLFKDQHTINIFFKLFDVELSPASQTPPTSTGSSEDICEISLEQMEIIFNRSKLQETNDIQAANERTIYKNMPVTLKDEFEIQISDPDNIQLFEGCVALVNEQTEKVVAVGKIEHATDNEERDLLYMTFRSEKICYSEFENQERFDILLTPLSEKAALCGPMDAKRAANCKIKFYILRGYSFKYAELQKTKRTLCIDFGTSNTTTGTFGLIGDNDNDINLVTFMDVTEERPVKRDMLPTMVYIESCQPNEEVVYKFGYEAKKELIEAGYDTKASVFFELKRWINAMDESEEIHDAVGNKTHVKHSEIIKKYLEHVIRQAEQQFKVQFTRLHFTAPVKLKENFLNKVKVMFPEYKVMDSNESLDEGMAIVYNHISNRMKTKKEDEYSEKILILDCGGGTTDLANCHYSYRNTQIGKSLKIKTFFKNGESNYGGNNITFRILQMLKIKIMQHMIGEDIKMQELIKEDESKMLKAIDDDYANKKKIYEAFERKYAEAERYIPTQFARVSMKEDKRMVKRNFYYLWQMAEAIKIQFYKANTNIVNVNFERDEERKIYVVSDKQYYLYVRTAGQGVLKKSPAPLNEIEITFKDIERIIEPDIYALLNTMLRLYESSGDKKKIEERLKELQEYYYRLSGQSCKVTLFPELLKEFIPGKILRRGKNRSVANRMSDELKKYCIEGSIEYMRDRERGFISPDIEPVTPTLIYDIRAEGRQDYNLSRNGEINVLTLPKNTSETTFVVYDEKGEVKNRVLYEFRMEGVVVEFDELKAKIESKTYYSPEQLQVVYDKLSDIDPRSRDYGESSLVFCLFALPSQEGYGMRIFQISVIDEGEGKYYSMPEEEPAFANYENEKLLTFFDGLR